LLLACYTALGEIGAIIAKLAIGSLADQVREEQPAMTVQVQDLVEAGIYPDVSTAIQEALRILWQERPQVRIDVAIHRYLTEDLSLAKAAALAGVSYDRMKEILSARGVTLRLGPETVEDALQEIADLGKMRS